MRHFVLSALLALATARSDDACGPVTNKRDCMDVEGCKWKKTTSTCYSKTDEGDLNTTDVDAYSKSGKNTKSMPAK